MSTISQASATGGGVRSIRNMFEKQAETSPEPRGRSPAGSVTSNSDRPRTKIRTSFVSVERPKTAPEEQKKDNGNGGGGNNESLNANESAQSAVVEELKRTLSAEKERDMTNRGPEDTEDMAIESSPVKTPLAKLQEDEAKENQNHQEESKSKDTATVTDNATNGHPKEADSAENNNRAGDKEPVNAHDDSSVPSNDPQPEEAKVESKAKGSDRTRDNKKLTNGTASGAAARTPQRPIPLSLSKETHIQPSPRNVPLPASPMATTRSKSNTKSPTASRGPKASVAPTKRPTTTGGGPSNKPNPSTAPSASTRRASTTKDDKSTGQRVAVSRSGPSNAASAKKQTVSPTTKTSASPFVKPKPKSPTRPIQLPSHLTAQTASSAAKHEQTWPQPSNGLNRKASVVNRDRAPPARTASLQKQPSRASLPGHVSGKRPESRNSTVGKAADDGFLARMMRPTASSSSKTHEKMEAKSPLRRAASVRQQKTSRSEASASKNRRMTGEEIGSRRGKENVGVAAESRDVSAAQTSAPAPDGEATRDEDAGPSNPADDAPTDKGGQQTVQDADPVNETSAETLKFEEAVIR